MKILYVAHKAPYPVLDGGCFAMKQFIEVLTDSAICDAFILETHKHPIVKDSKTYLKARFRNVYSDFIDVRPTFKGMMSSLFRSGSYLLSRFSSKPLEQFLQKNASQYDWIICDSLFALNACSSILGGNTKIAVRSHNIEHQVWITTAKTSKGWKKPVYKILAKQLKKAEYELLKKVDCNLAISSDDLNVFEQISPKSKNLLFPIHLAPTSIQTNSSINSCFFIGSLNWNPNIETVNYLIDCWSDNKLNNIDLNIAGSFSDQFTTRQLPRSVKFLGKVPSSEQFIASNGILVAPIFSGGGIKVKILEAMSCGAACITTEAGAQGIDSDEAGIIIVKNKEELISEVLKISSSTELRDSLGQKGRAYIQKNHSFGACKEIITVNFGR